MSPAPRVVVVSGPSPDFRLTIWPARYEPWPAWLIIAAAVGLSVAGGVISHSWLFSAAAIAAFAVALWRLWIPVEIRLYELGVTQTVMRRTWRTPWRGLSGYRVCRHGVLLMPEDDTSVLDTLQGLYIPWGKHRQELLELLDHFFSATRSPEQGTTTHSRRREPA